MAKRRPSYSPGKGAKVLLVDFQEDRARETFKIIQEEGGVASTMQGDMTKLEDCERMAQTAMERYGRGTSWTTTWVSLSGARWWRSVKRTGTGS